MKEKTNAVDYFKSERAFNLDGLIFASGAWAGDMADTTGGATHYHTTAIAPSWAAGHEPSARIGNHVFYNSVR